jgi:MFS family permease
MPNPNSWKTKLTLLLASSLTVMSGATVSPSLPAMRQQFESTISDLDFRTTLVKLVITLPALFVVIGSPIAGLIIDRFGRKSLLLITAILYGFAGIIRDNCDRQKIQFFIPSNAFSRKPL